MYVSIRFPKKIASGIGVLKRSRPFVPFETLLCIYNALVQPHFDYCSVILGNCNKTLSTKLQKLQTSSYDASANDLIIRLGWKKLDVQRKLQTATMVYKSLNGLGPDYISNQSSSTVVKFLLIH